MAQSPTGTHPQLWGRERSLAGRTEGAGGLVPPGSAHPVVGGGEEKETRSGHLGVPAGGPRWPRHRDWGCRLPPAGRGTSESGTGRCCRTSEKGSATPWLRAWELPPTEAPRDPGDSLQRWQQNPGVLAPTAVPSPQLSSYQPIFRCVSRPISNPGSPDASFSPVTMAPTTCTPTRRFVPQHPAE